MNDVIYSCQSTTIMKATMPQPNRIERYRCDIRYGLFRPLERIHMYVLWVNYRVQAFLLGKQYSRFLDFLMGNKISFSTKLKISLPEVLNLQPGELVEVRSKDEIRSTLDSLGKNRGLEFIPEMINYSGKKFRVLKRLDKMINEETGVMRKITNTVILEGLTCEGKHVGCQRTCYCLWREIWLKRLDYNSSK